MSFKHVGRCPVCKEVFDTLVTPERQYSGMLESLVFQDFRTRHAEKSPKCTKDPKWCRGWDVDDPVEVK